MPRWMPLALTLALLSSGCAAPSAAEIAKADYGAMPSDPEGVIKGWFESRLKDPFTAVYEFGAVEKAWRKAWRWSAPTYGWRTMVRVNARNSFGGYTGFKTYLFMLRGDQVAWVGEETHGRFWSAQ